MILIRPLSEIAAQRIADAFGTVYHWHDSETAISDWCPMFAVDALAPCSSAG